MVPSLFGYADQPFPGLGYSSSESDGNGLILSDFGDGDLGSRRCFCLGVLSSRFRGLRSSSSESDRIGLFLSDFEDGGWELNGECEKQSASIHTKTPAAVRQRAFSRKRDDDKEGREERNIEVPGAGTGVVGLTRNQ